MLSLTVLRCAPMREDTYKDWLTKKEAAAFLRVSEKTVERLAGKGDGRRAIRKRQGTRPSPVYSPDDLARVREAQAPQVALVPPEAEAAPQAQALAPIYLPAVLQALIGPHTTDVPWVHLNKGTKSVIAITVNLCCL